MKTARSRYDYLTSSRQHYLDIAVQCSELTLPYLITRDENRPQYKNLQQPWQSVGAKGVVTLTAKLMLSLLPPQTSFFKLQVRDDKLGTELPADVRSELDLSFAKIERMIMDAIAASSDRVQVFQAIKHLVVGGNALLFMDKDSVKHYPLNRYVVERDGNGNVIEIVTKELINKNLLPQELQEKHKNQLNNTPGFASDDAEIYTHVRLENNRWVWHQECYDTIMPGSRSKAPKEASPWIVLRFNTVDGENYGRGRVEEFLGDLRSLDSLSQSLVEGSASAAKVVFVVSPSSTTKPQTIAKAGNGAIVQGRPDDIGVIQVGKTADFATAQTMIATLEKRLSEAFLILNVRDSERTTAEEVRMTQMELEQQLGGLFSLLTVEFLIPYLNRKMLTLQRSGQLPKIPRDIVQPTIVAGINALGRGQDRESLTAFMSTLAQTIGPEMMMQFINPEEAIKRLAAAQGIDVLNLVKSMEDRNAESEAQAQQQQDQMQAQMIPQLLKTPIADPTKNPQAAETINQAMGQEVVPPTE